MKRSERNAAWIEKFCRVPEGKYVGQPVRLTRHQLEWLAEIYDSPTRRFILSMGRKNAKTATSAFLLLLHLCGPEAKRNAQLFSAAQSRDQAAILFSLAAKIVRMSPGLKSVVGVRDSTKQLYCAELGTMYRALSADASTAYGLSPSLVVHDELGQVIGPRSELYEALETASAAQEQPLSIVISTQAPNDADLLSLLIDDALKGDDPATKVRLYSASMDADPFEEATIRQANPHFDVFMNRDEVLSQAGAAKRMPSREASYRNLILNQRITLNNPFISRSVWNANGAQPDPDCIRNLPLYCGLDLSSRLDMTAFVATCEDDAQAVHVHAAFFAPRDGVLDRARRDRVPYDTWAEDGQLILTTGASVDYAMVAQYLAEFCAEHAVAAIAFDRWHIGFLQAELARIGANLPLVPFGQGFKDMTPALAQLETELLNSRLRHGGHPILKWNAANAVATRDPAGNRKLDKTKATGRIDGLVALAMARGVAKQAQPEENALSWLADPIL